MASLICFSILALGWMMAATAAYPPFPSLMRATADEMSFYLDQKCFTSADLVTAYTQRIGQVDSKFRAITELNPEALEEAKRLDNLRNETQDRGPLYGLPIVLKNVIATKDKMGNSAGSYALLNATNVREAVVAKKLRSAGAILLGKANLSQLGGFRSRMYSNGWSSHGGQVKGAYVPSQDPGGSSSGSAVAVDLGLAFAALGVDSLGSILLPAGRNNIVGIRPTLGLTSRDQVVPVSEHFDAVGPMARTVQDAAYLLQAIAGRDGYDKQTQKAPNPVPNYAEACVETSLRGSRLGVPWNFINAMIQGPPLDDELRTFRKALDELRHAGAIVVPVEFTMVEEMKIWRNDVLAIDYVANLNDYLAKLETSPNRVRSLADIRDWTKSHVRLEEYPNRDTELWDVFLKNRDRGWNQTSSSEIYQAALTRLKDLGGRGGILGVMKRSNLHAVVMPTSVSHRCVPFTGGPAVTVPMGAYPDNAHIVYNKRGDLVETGPGLPYGLTFAGKPWSEAELIGFAHAYEKRTQVRDKLRRRHVPLPLTEMRLSCRR